MPMLMRRLTQFASAIVLVLFFSARASAAPILTPSVTELADGFFQYGYTLTNLAGSGETIFDLGLFFDPSETVTNILAPTGWTSFPAGPGFLDFLSLDPTTDLLPGLTLSGFSFVSKFGPGAATFQTTGYATGGDPFDANPPLTGSTLGPSSTATPVPEPASLTLIGSGVVGLIAARRRKR